MVLSFLKWAFSEGADTISETSTTANGNRVWSTNGLEIATQSAWSSSSSTVNSDVWEKNREIEVQNMQVMKIWQTLHDKNFDDISEKQIWRLLQLLKNSVLSDKHFGE